MSNSTDDEPKTVDEPAQGDSGDEHRPARTETKVEETSVRTEKQDMVAHPDEEL